jgi:hypothetical protein
MAGLPKKYAKMGFAKGWQAYKATKSNSTRRTTRRIKSRSTGGVKYMAKRKYSGRKGTKSKSGMSKVLNIALGVGVAAIYEVFISPMIPLSRTIKNILELAIGVLLLSMKRLPSAVRAGGAALITINLFDLLVPLLSGAKGAASGSGSLSDFLQG